MKHVYGVEMKQPRKERLPEYYARVSEKTAELCHIIDHDKQLVIVPTKHEQTKLAAFYEDKELLEETYDLISIINGEKKRSFEDYGFMSNTGHAYLYKSLLCSYQVKSKPSLERDMGLLQMDEHLIAIETEKLNQPTYFIDANLKPLIKKTADVYHIKVEWLLC